MLGNKTDFLVKYQIDEKTYSKSKLKWDDLEEIYNDFIGKVHHLNSIGLSISNALQGQMGVHSVRYRVKDPEHLIEKVIRKVAENPQRKIDLSNYQQEITDLVGVRAIHLFKSNWQSIDHFVRQNWEFKEDPIAYFRKGDTEDIKSTFNSSKFDVKVHKAGYRSLHYVLITKPTKVEHFVELQVRTLFEEGWSEIDHKIRYPYDTNNDLINSLLMIFNRLAGSADEIGEYVKTLSTALKAKEEEYLGSLRSREKEIDLLKEQINGLKLNQTQKSKLYDSIDHITRLETSINGFSKISDWANDIYKIKDFIEYTDVATPWKEMVDVGKFINSTTKSQVFKEETSNQKFNKTDEVTEPKTIKKKGK
ncbi:RelA/SpoT domain-containing protein [Pedobacter nanyangensis]|uniref:RelA/SpoT domain-containing protein n=1 Tax=Pedobacter nanyangensis TaxID=1562389 RepID=UPI000DE3FE76|nr:RelA/SpoT domain-containing protein [Pedobacter nanyangensis]